MYDDWKIMENPYFAQELICVVSQSVKFGEE